MTTATLLSYDEYGVPAATNMGRFQYTGQAWLPELGAYYYKARMYAPKLGRFMQTDPIGYGDGVNWYNYVGNDPVNGTDPSGLTVSVGSLTCDHEVIWGNDGPYCGSTFTWDIDRWQSSGGGRGAGGEVGGGGSGGVNGGDEIFVTAKCDDKCETRNANESELLNQFYRDFKNNIFVCLGGNIGLAGGVCRGGGDWYLYNGLGFPRGLDLTIGAAPNGAAGYLAGWSVAGNGLPGAGVSFTDGSPSSNAWTIGTPGVSATYGRSFTSIGQHFADGFRVMANGFYNRIGRPYGD